MEATGKKRSLESPTTTSVTETSSSSSNSSEATIGNNRGEATKKSKISNVMQVPPLCYDEFLSIWDRVHDIQGIERGSLIKRANGPKAGGEGQVQERAQYGRILPKALRQIFEKCKADANSVVLDLGHGIGSAVVQAALTLGCDARGIEIVKDRCIVADAIWEQIKMEVEDKEEREVVEFKKGEVKMIQGDFTNADHKEFVTTSSIIIVNNFGEIFGARSARANKPALDDYVAGLFAATPPGTQMVTLHPLYALGPSVEEEYNVRNDDNIDASFFSYEEFDLEPQAVTWSNKPIKAYYYLRTAQTSHDGAAYYCCRDPNCLGFKEGTAAVRYDEFACPRIADECIYCESKRKIARRRHVMKKYARF